MDRRNFLKGFIASTTVAALAPVSLLEVPILESTKWVDFEQIATITLNKYRPILADAFLSSPRVYFNPYCISKFSKSIELDFSKKVI